MHAESIPLLALILTGFMLPIPAASVGLAPEQTPSPTTPSEPLVWNDYELPWYDTLPSAVDMTWLNDRPAGTHGKLHVSPSGHFEFEDGTRVRFLGTSVCWGWGAPSKTDAEIIAGRLAKFGFNLLRFHKIESLYRPDDCIFDLAWGDTRHLKSDWLDRFDYFVYQLKQHGIYIDMNLHAERFFLRGDGVVEWQHLPVMAKYVTLFNDTMIDLQKEYATNLLCHVNPYTGMSLAEDPVLAMIEVTNENSLFLADSFDQLYGLGQAKGPTESCGELPQYYVSELDHHWNDWLSKMYANVEDLRSAWAVGEIPFTGPSLILNGEFSTDLLHWSFGSVLPEIATLSRDTVVYHNSPASARIHIQQCSGSSYSNIWVKQDGIHLAADRIYTLTFWARASDTLNVLVDGWGAFDYTGEDYTVSLNWRKFSFTFKTVRSQDSTLRINLGQNGVRNVSFWLDSVELREGGIQGLMPSEDPWIGTVLRIPFSERRSFTLSRMMDQVRFYVDLESQYFSEMRDHLRGLGVAIPITGTNSFYGPASLLSQARMDYLDQHCYWDPAYIYHNLPWNYPMVNDTYGGTIPWVLASAVAGKPITVSEYNHYSTQATCIEGPVFLAAYSAFQDLDGVMLFGIHGEKPLGIRYITSPYDIDPNPLYMALIPFVALMYRRGDVSVAQSTLYYYFDRSLSIRTYLQEGVMTHYEPFELGTTPLEHGVRKLLSLGPSEPPSLQMVKSLVGSGCVHWPVEGLPESQDTPSGQYEFTWRISDTGELFWSPLTGVFLVNASRTQGALGFFNQANLSVLSVRSYTNFSVVMASALDGNDLASSDHILIYVGSQVRNTGWRLGNSRDAEYWGRPPTQIRLTPVSVRLELDTPRNVLHVFALDPTGRRLYALTPTVTDGRIVCFESQNDAVWYELLCDPVPVAHISEVVVTPSGNQSVVMARGYAENVLGSSTYWWEVFPADNTTGLPIFVASSSQLKTRLPPGRYVLRFMVRDDSSRTWSDPSVAYIDTSSQFEPVVFAAAAGAMLAGALIASTLFRRRR
ncbi:MAG: hypothetical protein QXS20_03470 [Candidatus Thorarchaeota archaeon]